MYLFLNINNGSFWNKHLRNKEMETVFTLISSFILPTLLAQQWILFVSIEI